MRGKVLNYILKTDFSNMILFFQTSSFSAILKDTEAILQETGSITKMVSEAFPVKPIGED